MPPAPDGRIYSATYSNVPVYEFNVGGNHVMRRRADDWINATHILKVADFDKPARTRILEREVQKGVHEKVQGGYGKYQGTWVPLHEGRLLAERNGVLDKLLPILDFIPGDRSPPPAPKHATASSNRAKPQRQSAAAIRRSNAAAAASASFLANSQSEVTEEHYDDSQMLQSQTQIYRDMTPDNVTIISESMLGDQDMMDGSQYAASSRKRKRGSDYISLQDQQHQVWADQLLDYFVLQDSEQSVTSPPWPPANVDLDRPIDDKGHTAMHWAAAMGDVDVVRELQRRGARIDSVSKNLETPLMRAVMFTNNFDKESMPQMIRIFLPTVSKTDWFGSTVFHHIAATTSSGNKFACARYYIDRIIEKLLETWNPDGVLHLLNRQDNNGDTALHIVARNEASKCVRALLGRNAAIDIQNHNGETADDILRYNQQRKFEARRRQASSSPFAPPPERSVNGHSRFEMAPGPLASLPFPPFPGATAREPTQYESQTAKHIMSSVAPTLYEKCERLAMAFEAELSEKQAEAQEAERVITMRKAELAAITRQTNEVINTAKNNHIDLNDDQAIKAQEHELRELVAEAESLLEIEQKAELRRLCASIPEQPTNAPDDLAEKLRLSVLLWRAQVERRELVREVVANLAVAGMSEKQGVYKALISKAIGGSEEDVEEILADILKELEEADTQARAEGLETSPL
ncbi:apses-domain-containing protein [Sporormia fimetaria CBS 119925]|uniref:Apses-domain-containing protein n=1 Tax=Sporormia fimetaria CBS 119925 TaxID=1340428 RepID=A0A6A6UYR4_9PLEO|nr:apses-domain-containing protein [Sporormia fimetaria CBS 119925]